MYQGAGGRTGVIVKEGGADQGGPAAGVPEHHPGGNGGARPSQRPRPYTGTYVLFIIYYYFTGR